MSPRVWKSAEERGEGLASGREELLLLLMMTSLGGGTVTSDPGDNILLARLRLKAGGGGSSLGIGCLNLQGESGGTEDCLEDGLKTGGNFLLGDMKSERSHFGSLAPLDLRFMPPHSFSHQNFVHFYNTTLYGLCCAVFD